MNNSGFSSLGLDPRLEEVLASQGIDKPFPIQAECLPLALAARDILAQARTGSGKTLAFALPSLNYLLNHPFPGEVEKHDPEILVLCPTRELCQQVETVFQELGSTLGVKTLAIYGGTKYEGQIESIVRGVDVVVATPGRLIDLVQRKEISLAQVKILILDEADEMLDLGFADAVESIFAMTDSSRQTLLFSATFSANIVAIGRKYMQSPTRITVDELATSDEGISSITQYVWQAHQMDKIAILNAALSSDLGERTIIFTRTKRNAQRVCDDLKALGIKALAIHGDMPQISREKSLSSFTDGKGQVLVATDVAARGIHVDDISLVINYDCPDDAKSYTHRIGRTGRAGKVGVALTLVDWADVAKWTGINKQLDGELPDLPSEIYSNSEETMALFPKTRVHVALPVKADPKKVEKRSPKKSAEAPKKKLERKERTRTITRKNRA